MIQAYKFAASWRKDPQGAAKAFMEGINLHREGESGGVAPEEYSIQDLAAEFVEQDGRPIGMRGMKRLYHPAGQAMSLTEATAGVDSSAFANITGQLLISKILAAYQSEEFVVSRLVQTIPTMLKGEKIPGVENLSDPGQEELVVNEAQEYPTYGFGEDYIETPVTVKRGLRVPITKESIFFDRTNLVLSSAGDVGTILGTNKEKRLIDQVVGGVEKLYKRKGTEFWTYYSENDSDAPYVNHLSGNQLVDWTDVDNAEDLFSEMLDPNTNEPIVTTGRQMLVCPQLHTAASRILNATETRSGTSNITIGPNPNITRGITLFSSRLLYARLIATDAFGHSVSAANAKGYWWLGDFSKAFAYMENWPITVTRAPQNSPAEFNQDIVAQFKASEMGAAAVMEPRVIVRNRADATSSSSGA